METAQISLSSRAIHLKHELKVVIRKLLVIATIVSFQLHKG